MSAEAAEANAPTASEYIVHHLTHWQVDMTGHAKPQVDIVDFSIFNLDSLFFSVLLGVVGCLLLWKAARHATAGVPGRFQAAVEILMAWSRSSESGSSLCCSRLPKPRMLARGVRS